MKTKFLDWNEKILTVALKELQKEIKGGVPDFSHICIVTQTTQSGRKLKFELSKKFIDGFFPPEFVTTEFFLRNTNRSVKLPSPIDEKFIWMETIRTAPDDLTEKIKLHKNRGLETLATTASRFCEIRRQLAENFLTIISFAEKLSQMKFEETERWAGFAELEKIYLAKLKECGYEDPELLKIHSEPDFEILKGISKIIILGLCDPVPVAIKKIAKIAEKIETEIWIHAPKELEEYFDEWGRPKTERWKEYKLNIEADQVVSARDFAKTAKLTVCKFTEFVKKQEACAIAMLNKDMLPYLEKEFSRKGVNISNPAGISVSGTPIFNLLSLFADFLQEKSFDAFANFAHHTAFLKFIKKLKKDKFQIYSFLNELDDFRNKVLPIDFEDIKSSCCSENILCVVTESENLISLFKEKSFSVALKEMLTKVFDEGSDFERMSELSKIDPNDFGENLNSLFSEIENSEFESSNLPPAEKLKFLIEYTKGKNTQELSSDNAVTLSGWLEMQFENSENIILCGMNEGYLPEAPSNDIFMPDSIREKFSLRCAASRFARDCYILKTVIQSRKKENLSFIVPKTALRNEPLMPSRLLFLNDDDGMIAKIAEKVFGHNNQDIPEEPAVPSIQWQLEVPKEVLPDRLSITDFKNYMDCPFRFYLSKVLKMRSLDFAKMEMDSLDFGNIIHEIMKKFAENKALVQETDIAKIADFFISTADEIVNKKFGKNLTATLFIQLENMKTRLAKFANIQAEENSKGWRILYSEFPTETKINGMIVRGRIDRIDISADEKTLRILDYKTSDNAESPEKTHIIKYNSEKIKQYRQINDSNKGWKDLQLPLYMIMLPEKQEFKNKKIICAYANLPKALSDTNIEEWEISAEYIESARKCAEAIVGLISNFVFWPPSDNVKYDDYSEILLGDPLKSINPKNLLTKQ